MRILRRYSAYLVFWLFPRIIKMILWSSGWRESQVVILLYLGRNKIAIFTITVYVNIIAYMYLYIDARAQVFSAIWHPDRCNAESSVYRRRNWSRKQFHFTNQSVSKYWSRGLGIIKPVKNENRDYSSNSWVIGIFQNTIVRSWESFKFVSITLKSWNLTGMEHAQMDQNIFPACSEMQFPSIASMLRMTTIGQLMHAWGSHIWYGNIAFL